MTGEWKAIPGFDGYYASRDGRILSKRAYKGNGELVLKPTFAKGYGIVSLCDGHGAITYRTVHSLVMETFVSKCPDGMECRHLDGDKRNNQLSNLAWGTPKENQHDRLEHGTDSRGEQHGRSKLNNEDVVKIRELVAIGGKHRDIAKLFGVAHCTIGRVARRENWGHI